MISQLNTDPVATAILKLEAWLTTKQNSPAVEQLALMIKQLLGGLSPAQWQIARQTLNQYLLLSILSKSMIPEIRVLLTRLVLVIGLIDAYNAQPSSLTSSSDVFAALRWRTPIIPDIALPTLTKTASLLARKPGFSDLYIVRQEWNRYEATEIASIENVLPGELKGHYHEITNQTTVTTTVQQETAKLTQLDVTTTDRSELHNEATTNTQLTTHIDGKVDTSGQYGPTNVNTHLGGSLDYSASDSKQTATTQTHEIVARAVTKVEEKVMQIRTTQTMVRVTDKDRHVLDNKGQNQAVVGVYRWVDRVDRVQMMKYPHRFLLEFEIPEPGAWLRWLHVDDTSRNLLHPPPTPFTVDGNPESPTNPRLTAADINTSNYLKYGARYATPGLSPPPQTKTVSVSLERDSPDDPAQDNKERYRYQVDNTATVPDGYVAKTWKATVLTEENTVASWTLGRSRIAIAVGAGDWGEAGGHAAAPPGGSGSLYPVTIPHPPTILKVGPISEGTIPVSLEASQLQGLAVGVEISCDPSSFTLQNWQRATYDQIVAAYYTMKQASDDERSSRTIQQKSFVDASSPTRNQQATLEEIKRQVVEMLTGQRFTGRNAIMWDPPYDKAPEADLQKAAGYAPEIQFIEQIFEWENLSYVLYPYYWGDQSRWPDLARIEGVDDAFASFLRAGSARVVLPVRPGFEDQANLYSAFGIIWGGGPVPAPGDSDYLSVAEEIRNQQMHPRDGEQVDAWEIRVPTTLVWLENPTPLPTNGSATIKLPAP